jgi:hypothetical protein
MAARQMKNPPRFNTEYRDIEQVKGATILQAVTSVTQGIVFLQPKNLPHSAIWAWGAIIIKQHRPIPIVKIASGKIELIRPRPVILNAGANYHI